MKPLLVQLDAERNVSVFGSGMPLTASRAGGALVGLFAPWRAAV